MQMCENEITSLRRVPQAGQLCLPRGSQKYSRTVILNSCLQLGHFMVFVELSEPKVSKHARVFRLCCTNKLEIGIHSLDC